jgi:hypothetical protein
MPIFRNRQTRQERSNMKTPDPAHAPLSIRLAWLAAFVGASLLFTPGLGCEVPLIAFAAICGMRLARREALLFAATVWLTWSCLRVCKKIRC